MINDDNNEKKSDNLNVNECISLLNSKASETQDVLIVRVTEEGALKFTSTLNAATNVYILECAKFDVLFTQKMNHKLKATH